MLQYYNIPEPTMMKEQQQECSEIHTIQIFRDAPSYMLHSSLNQGLHQSFETIAARTLILQTEVADGIGEWEIEMDEDVMDMEQPSAELDRTPHSQEGESSLYSFYFETPVVSMGHDGTSEDYTITSHDTESFRNEENLDLNTIDDIWEQGLDQPSSNNEQMRTLQCNQSSLRDNIFRDNNH